MFKISSLLATAFLAATLTASAPAQAQPQEPRTDSTSSVVVRYGDLDIGRPAGADILLRRIAKAASRVCGDQPDTRTWSSARAFERCRSAAIANAVARVGTPALLARHEERFALAKR